MLRESNEPNFDHHFRPWPLIDDERVVIGPEAVINMHALIQGCEENRTYFTFFFLLSDLFNAETVSYTHLTLPTTASV